MNGNGPRVFLKLTRTAHADVAGPEWWHEAADIVGLEQFDGWTRLVFRDGAYGMVDESAETVLKMMGAAVVTPALTRPPGTLTPAEVQSLTDDEYRAKLRRDDRR